MTLLEETIEELGGHYLSPSDVEYVKDYLVYCTWEEFSELANHDYDNGFGANEVSLYLKVVGKDWWLERHEYDGSEWWEFKSMPEKPNIHDKDKINIWDKYSDVHSELCKKLGIR